MKELWHDYMQNTERWQTNSDGWVKSMTESKEMKEEYQKYLIETDEPITLVEWIKQQKGK
tara:strand:+ start:2039 stop:2218 length:180 start_codon:yes stop_codon:yes gene_type:complete